MKRNQNQHRFPFQVYTDIRVDIRELSFSFLRKNVFVSFCVIKVPFKNRPFFQLYKKAKCDSKVKKKSSILETRNFLLFFLAFRFDFSVNIQIEIFFLDIYIYKQTFFLALV